MKITKEDQEKLIKYSSQMWEDQQTLGAIAFQRSLFLEQEKEIFENMKKTMEMEKLILNKYEGEVGSGRVDLEKGEFIPTV